jgi:hypothetical protein
MSHNHKKQQSTLSPHVAQPQKAAIHTISPCRTTTKSNNEYYLPMSHNHKKQQFLAIVKKFILVGDVL